MSSTFTGFLTPPLLLPLNTLIKLSNRLESIHGFADKNNIVDVECAITGWIKITTTLLTVRANHCLYADNGDREASMIVVLFIMVLIDMGLSIASNHEQLAR